MAEAVKELVDE